MYQKVLVTLDGSSLAECVLSHATAVAKGCAIPEVWLLRVVEPMPIGEGVTQEFIYKVYGEREKVAREYLDGVAKGLRDQGLTVNTAVVQGQPADEIAGFVEKNKVDLIVMATHGRSGIGRWVLGSVSDRVLREAKVPVLMVRCK
ncbi:MAG: universal stress protein [Dehalococcoidia bacterium]